MPVSLLEHGGALCRREVRQRRCAARRGGALWHGYTGSMRDGLSAAAKALKGQEPVLWRLPDHGRAGDQQAPTTIRAERRSADDSHRGARSLWARSALPTSWIGAADDFAKVINYRAEARALAYPRRHDQGAERRRAVQSCRQLMNNMPEHIHLQARNAALRNTFQEPLTGDRRKAAGHRRTR
jgi:hypothetical protein